MNDVGSLFASTAFASGATNSTDQKNPNNVGISVFVNVTALAGTSPTLTIQLQMKDPVSGQYVNIPGAATPALSATGQYLLQVYPGIAVTANQQVSAALPYLWRAVATVGGSASPTVTASIGFAYHQ